MFSVSRSLRKQPTFLDAASSFNKEMASEKRAKNSILMTCPYPYLGSGSDWLKSVSSNQTHYPDLGSNASIVWSFCVRFSDVISRGNHWWRREMSGVFSDYVSGYV